MSYQAVGWVLRHSDIKGAQRMVLTVLAEHHNYRYGTCAPSIATIAEEACLDRRTVTKALARLEDVGLVERERGGGRGNVTRYWLLFMENRGRGIAGNGGRSATNGGRGAGKRGQTPPESVEPLEPLGEAERNRGKGEVDNIIRAVFGRETA